MHTFISSSCSAKPDLFEITVVEVADEAKSMKRVFELAFDSTHVVVDL